MVEGWRRKQRQKKSYKQLVVWQRAIDLVPKIHSLLKGFPKEETYALADQVRKSVVFIPANIAEGQARPHKKEFLQHPAIAKGSLAELHTLLIIAEIARGTTGPAFDHAAFSLDVGKISNVTSSPSGYQIIQRIE